MRTLLLAGLMAGVSTAAAFAQDAASPTPPPAPVSNRYIAVGGGMVGAGDYSYGPGSAEYDAGPQFSVAYGMRLESRPNVRVEAALSARKQEGESRLDLGLVYLTYDDAKISAFGVDINAYYDFPVQAPVRPYVGAGFGLAGVSIDDGMVDDTGTTANVQLMAGATIPAGSRAQLFAEGRWQRIGMFTIDATAIGGSDDEKTALSGFGAVAGVRVRF